MEKNYDKKRSSSNSSSDEGGMDDKGGRNFIRKRACRFCVDKTLSVDFKDQATLKYFVTERGKIIPRRVSGCCAKHQRQVALSVKQARGIALIPYVVVGS
jgi:small subunit ribosomal protein S18